MKIIISPAKKMNQDEEILSYLSLPVYLKEATKIKDYLQSLSYEQLKQLWNCNDKIASLNDERLKKMDLESKLTPAILSYEGIQYQYMAPAVFEESMLAYIQTHLRIISGFYGVLKPMDGITPYRLEMQAQAKIEDYKDLYDYWGSKIYEEVKDDVIINLASKEYSKCVEDYLQPNHTYLTCIFGELKNGKVVQKGTYAKMARGEMVRYMAQHKIENVEDLKNFTHLGYRYHEEFSSTNQYVFIK